MKKKLFIGSLILLLTGLISTLAYMGFHFYFFFGNSNRLFQFRHNHSSHLEFYTDRWTYHPGEEIRLFVSSSPADTVHVEIFEITENTNLLPPQRIAASFQKVGIAVSVEGALWDETTSLVVPDSCKTGWYVLKLQNDDFTKRTSIFIAPQEMEVRKRLALILSTNTWNAYNYWGGKSLYTRNYTPTVSFRRPQLLADPFISRSMSSLQFFFQAANKDRYSAELLAETEIDFDVYSMVDLHRSEETFRKYDLLIISTHSEYWTVDMMTHLNLYLETGGSLFSLSGNTAAFVSYLSDSSLTVYKEAEGMWLRADTAHTRPFGTEISFMGYHTYAPYQVLVDSSWVFAHTGLQAGDLFGQKSDTYDPTHMYGNVWENLIDIFLGKKMGAASGLEVDRKNKFTPSGWISVAQGLNPEYQGAGEVYPEGNYNWTGDGGADMGYYLHPGGGYVFNVSSVAFTGAIPYDKHVRQVVLNVVEKGLKQ